MNDSRLEQLRVIWFTARRAGLKRSFARVRRIFLLRVLYPRLAERMYTWRVLPVPLAERFPQFVPHTDVGWDGMVRLLHTEPFAMRAPVDWEANPIRHALWAFRLHEWEWALPLIQQAQTDVAAASELTSLIQDYIARVPFGHPVAFEPYPLSRRLVVWCHALRSLSRTSHDSALMKTLVAGMDRGARMLADNIEHDLDNNHVIANAKALAFVGTLLAQPYGGRGFALLWEELRLQVSADGVHVENSTLYHFLAWRDAVETVLLARQHRVEIPVEIESYLDGMNHFLLVLQHPDGTFPLLNDSVQDEVRYDALCKQLEEPRQDLLHRLRDAIPPLALLRESGYAILRSEGMQLVLDAGALGPIYCPGHGHADTLSFELFALGKARIVDSGTYQYQAGFERDFFRGTAAHNTLQVDGLDSSEVSGSFRVGRMANARLWTEGDWVCGEHDGYTRLRESILHTRKIRMGGGNTILIRDEIRGRGEHDYALRFHLAPGARASVAGKTARIDFENDVMMEIEIANATGELTIGEGWYSPTWYTKCPAPVVEMKWRGEPPFEIQTRIQISKN